MSRVVDEHYFTYSALTSGIQVKCPKCHGPGVVTGDKGSACFRCLSCGHQMARNRTAYRYDVHNVACPYCGAIMSGKVQRTAQKYFFYGAEILDGREPWFGLELWFLTSFQGKPVWALNREHLAYLIDYLSAGLREKPPGIVKKRRPIICPPS